MTRERERSEDKLQEIKVTEFEVSIMEREIMNYVMRELQSIEAFWRYRHRRMMQLGIDVESSVQIKTVPGGLVMTIEVKIPRDLVVDMARRKKRRMLKFPKEHPLTRRAYRMADNVATKVERHLLSMIEEFEEEGEE